MFVLHITDRHMQHMMHIVGIDMKQLFQSVVDQMHLTMVTYACNVYQAVV